jgi:hypothetical protein
MRTMSLRTRTHAAHGQAEDLFQLFLFNTHGWLQQLSTAEREHPQLYIPGSALQRPRMSRLLIIPARFSQ